MIFQILPYLSLCVLYIIHVYFTQNKEKYRNIFLKKHQQVVFYLKKPRMLV